MWPCSNRSHSDRSAVTRMVLPATSALGSPHMAHSVGRWRRTSSRSCISSWTSEKLWISSRAAAAGTALDGRPPTASQANMQRAGRSIFPKGASTGLPCASHQPIAYRSIRYAPTLSVSRLLRRASSISGVNLEKGPGRPWAVPAVLVAGSGSGSLPVRGQTVAPRQALCRLSGRAPERRTAPAPERWQMLAPASERCQTACPPPVREGTAGSPSGRGIPSQGGAR